MSRRYRILPKPFQQAPPSPDMREQVKKDLCGNTDGFVMLQTSMRYTGHPSRSTPFTLQEEEKLCNPVTCHSYIIDNYVSDYVSDPITYELVITYETREGPREEIVSIRPDRENSSGLLAPTLLFTFYPYDVRNPNDTSYYSYTFSTTNLQWAIRGVNDNGFKTFDISPDANNGRWILYTSSTTDQMTPSELCYNQYMTFHKHYSDFSFHIRTKIGPGSSDVFIYSQVLHLIPVYNDPRYGNSLTLFNEIREHTLPPPYS